MNIRWRKTCLALVVVSSLLGGALITHAAEDVGQAIIVSATVKSLQLEFDGRQLAPTEGESAFVIDGVTYVPLRFMANTAELSVSWDEATSTVKVKEPSTAERIALKERNMNMSSVSENKKPTDAVKNLVVYRRAITYHFGDIRKETSQGKEGLIYSNRLYIPLRFFSESIGKQVAWDPITFKITITTPERMPEPTIAESDKAKAEDKKSAPVTPALPIGAIGGVGGGSKPSYESLTATAEVQLEQLKTRCESNMTSILNRYNETKDMQLMAEGYAELAACNSAFNQIVNALQSELTNNGYDTAIIIQYRTAYDQMKEQKKKEILGN
ncbi:copper amine oxidase N-terminal domain-containing protein [Paenibacillus sp.]|uniref:copper amine oxidase N-terminal domain-containing protein n=1 Tax=Paenibacillus sp. TaxID=58172 RepID=UPI002D3705B2|nr:copper amine oxidase N-terminal domain-containing protein [Paenibacillus sp.]HZG86163.1 copper amine oxidase N-terminal domain-containing protein [Paenibacillus sp.]